MILFFLLNVLLMIWVLIDAKKRKQDWPSPFALTLVFGVFYVPFYLSSRNLLEGETREGGKAWNVLKYFSILWTLFAILNTIRSIILTFLQTNSVINMGYIAALGILFLFWIIPVTGALIIGLFLKKSTIEKGKARPNDFMDEYQSIKH